MYGIPVIKTYSALTLYTLNGLLCVTYTAFLLFYFPRFFCDCGAGALGCDCLLTGYKAFSSPKVNSRIHPLPQGMGSQQQPSAPPIQLNTSTS